MLSGSLARRRHLFGMLLALFATLMVVVTGCGQTTNQTAAQGTANSSEGNADQVVYTVQHAMGSTTIHGIPKRIVVLTNEGTEAVLALGIKPVGAVKSWEGNPWYPHIANEMQGVEVVGDENQPNIEKIAALKPDLILGNKMRQEKVYSQLSKIAPTVFSEDLRGDWKQNFQLYAKALHKEQEGAQKIAEFNQHVAQVRDKLGDKLSTQVSLVRFMPGTARIYYDDTFAGTILNEVGLKRPKAQQKHGFADNVTKERIPDMDGDVIFYYIYDTGDGKGKAVADDWTQDPLWKQLSAVKKNHVFTVDDSVWNTSGGILSANLMLDQLVDYLNKL
ncbi:ABC transporter substrate-binding protein [Alicyclobacillus macrosporangiidus]|uniref:Iron complex transport system substrate-binding protein n=1 Tax=Alicyclobacillus macrosporangiidus TaxID=392015 RepID=A0A1I7JHB5_9BACL|nr:iron-siderophore ABC transporter substrate-binding protein [Alicyclobacillus macrosporangiidus]SFU84575.1 iron complex transport system substrate-binding protein [Alicyclobacillus macrosporangiidus]